MRKIWDVYTPRYSQYEYFYVITVSGKNDSKGTMQIYRRSASDRKEKFHPVADVKIPVGIVTLKALLRCYGISPTSKTVRMEEYGDEGAEEIARSVRKGEI